MQRIGYLIRPRAREMAAADASDRPRGSVRDLRLDFFRGLALIFIFIDHVPGNSMSHWTMRAMGISDAAEVFVLIAGYAAFLAYSGPLEREGLWMGARRIWRRIRDLYAAHIMLVAICAAILAVAARYFENPLYFEHVNLTPLSYDPLGAIWQLVALSYQPGYLNILPLYIALLAWFPLLWWLLKRQPYAALGLSVGIWAAAGWGGLNLQSWPEVYGWFFNPFAWQLLFTIGAFAALKAKQGARLSRSPVLIWVALLPISIGFVVSAPWINIPGLHLPRLVPFDALGYVSKTHLSLWRLAHILALAYLVALLVPASAAWLRSRFAMAVVHCGRNGLDIFCLGTIFSFLGFVMLLEAGRSWEFQLAVNAIGIGAMLGIATWLTEWKQRRATARRSEMTTAVPVVERGEG